MAAQWRVPVLCCPEYDSATAALRLLQGALGAGGGGVEGGARCPGLHPAEAGLHVAAPDPPCRARSSASRNTDLRARYRPSIISGPPSLWMLLRGLLEFEALTWLPASASRYLTALLNRCARL